ncbi:MAG: diacylglycerol kinase family protein [Phycisphaeraceae bacterium]
MNRGSRWRTGWRASFAHALRGLGSLIAGEPNARWHLAGLLLVIVLGVLCGITKGEWLAVLLASGLVLVAEAMNTAIEAMGDAISPEHHEMIGRAKDVAAAGVLLASIAALVVGVLVFGDDALRLSS